MPMHPAVETFELFTLLELLLGDDRAAALQRLLERGFVSAEVLPHWLAELEQAKYGQGASDLVAAAKMLVDPKAAVDSKLSCKEPLAILANLQILMQAARQIGREEGARPVGEQTILDVGSGIYYALSSAALLYANGYRRAIAYEPFELKTDYVVAALMELLAAVYREPRRFCMLPGVDGVQLKRRLAELDFEGLPARLERLNRREVDSVDLGGVLLTNRSESIADGSVDRIFSNSVLEHVGDLATELRWHLRVMGAGGLCFHTVDFADHRYYFDRRLSIVEMYFDGVLDGVNGLRPSQMESIFLGAGFGCAKLARLAIPPELMDLKQREVVAPFAGLPRGDFLEWINGYVLHKP